MSLAVEVLVVGLGAILLWDAQRLKPWLVGVGAGLDFYQVAHVHVFTMLTVFWFLTSRERLRGLTLTTLAILGAALLLAATSFVGPLTVNHTLSLQLVAFALTALLIQLRVTAEEIRYMTLGLVSICLLSAIYGILQKVGILPLRTFIAVGGAGRVEGIYREPDWLGLFCAVGIVATLRLDLGSRLKFSAIGLLALGMLFSQARASFIALLVVGAMAMGAGIVSRGDRERRRRNRKVLIGFVILAAAGFALSPGVLSSLTHRFQSGFSSSNQDIGAQARVLQIQSLKDLARGAPWYGDGFSASGRVQVHGFIEYGQNLPASDSVSTDWVLGWWVDGKYVALPIIILLIGLALRSVPTLGGQLLITVLVASLVSDGIMLPIAWFAVALCLTGGTRKAETVHESALTASGSGLALA
jgi:hypothetical protein